MAVEKSIKELNDKYIDIYLVISSIIGLLLLNIDIELASFIVLLVFCAIFSTYVKNRKLNDLLNIVPFTAMIPSIYASKWAVIANNNINMMVLASIVVIILATILSVKRSKINIYTMVSTVYILLQSFVFNLNIYVNLTIAIIWALTHIVFMNEERIKFKVAIYFLLLVLYSNIIKDISEVNDYIASITALKYIGYIVFAFAITRDVLKKKGDKSYKYIEYIFCTVCYLHALTNYTSEADGMIFVLMLAAITVISYIHKFGPIFFSSLVAIIVNVFVLTREFWFSIPWWIYLLVIGSTLILFAINNEVNEKKQKGHLKNKINSIKEHLDM